MLFLLIFNVLFIILYAAWFKSRFNDPCKKTYVINDIKYYRGERGSLLGANLWYEFIEKNKGDYQWTEQGKQVNDPEILNKLNSDLLAEIYFRERKKDRALTILVFLDFIVGIIIYEINYLPSDY